LGGGKGIDKGNSRKPYKLPEGIWVKKQLSRKYKKSFKTNNPCSKNSTTSPKDIAMEK